MKRAFCDAAAPFVNSDSAAATVICRTSAGNLHLGLMYRLESRVNYLHLAWYDTLDASWPWHKIWAVPASVSSVLLSQVGPKCRRILQSYTENGRRFPYGLRWGGTTFREDGSILVEGGARGLTCATFVLAVLRSVGIVIIREEEWQARPAEDSKFIDFVRNVVRQPARADELQKELEDGATRIFPTDVLGACAADRTPIGFIEAVHLGPKVEALIDACAPSV